jgi:tripeptidyl-peptidase-1
MRSFALLATLATVVSNVVAPNPATYNAPYPSLRVFEALRRLPQGWTKQDAPSSSARLRLRIALQEPDHEFFEKTLFAVSDPRHEKYGQHLKRDEVKALIKPRDESTEAVLSYVLSHIFSSRI